MSTPSSSAEFLDLVQKSGLVEEKRLAAYTDKLRGDNALPAQAKELADRMIRDGVLTHFQAEQILLGKWRRFNIGKYKVLERLGSGGMGSVYLCEHKLMCRRVAVKVLPTAKANDPSSLLRFQREAKAIAALDHPNIVRAYDIDEDEKLHFLVMEHVDGSSLQDIVKKTGPMDYTRAAHYIRQAALGLQHAHDAAAIVHRDIKPGNVLVDRSGVVKILDMGLARFFNDEEDILTKKYDETVLGTADYLAPEQATDSHNVDIRADVYSLGATFYFCLTGRTPFAEGTVAQKLIWHQTRLPKPIRGFRADVPDALLAVIDKAMAKDVTQRFQMPVEFAEALDPWTQSPIPPPPADEMPQLSLAAMGGAAPESGATIVRGGDTGAEPPSSRKVWQVPGTPSPRPTPKPAPSPIAMPPKGNPPPRKPPPASAAEPPPTVVKRTGPHGGARPQANLNGRVRAANAAKPAVATAEDPDAIGAVTDTKPGLHAVATPPIKSKKKVVPAEAPPAPSPSLADKSPLFWGLAGAGVLVAVGALAGLIWLAVHLLGAAPPPNTGGTTVPFTVGGPNDLTIEDVLRRARPDDRIILQGDIKASGVVVKWPNLTIESAPGTNYTWRPADKADPKTPLLDLEGVEGVVVRGVHFEGGGRTETLIQLRGMCPGLTLQDLELTTFSSCGIRVTNAEGTKDKPIVFNRLKISHRDLGQYGIIFDQDPLVSFKRPNQWFNITDCKAAKGKLVVFIAPGALENVQPPDFFK
jgi:eukaryotic-like serine/threonine-protein kinase